MGSFAGHIDEAIFFLLLALWWMYNIFPDYIQAQWRGRQHSSTISYNLTVCKRSIPVETTIKILFPLAGFLAEIGAAGGHFVDKDGHFFNVSLLQHMTIYALFVLHGVIDLAMNTFRVPLPAGLDYISAALSFAWYGITFQYHVKMHGKEGLETVIHVLPIYVIYLAGVCVLLELWKPHSFLITLARIYSLLMMGSWFFHISFIMYLPSPFPGNQYNPNWDHHDMGNVHFMVALFGFHLIGNLVFVVLLYIVAYCLLKRRDIGLKASFEPLLPNGKGHEADGTVIAMGPEEEDLDL